MNFVSAKYTRVGENADHAIEPKPAHGYQEDAGADLYAAHDALVGPGQVVAVGTGLAVELQPGSELQVRSRGGLARKHQVFVLNSPGTVDPGYRGEIGVLLFNAGKEPFYVLRGDRIAQAVVAPYFGVKWQEVEELAGSRRGKGAYGSTGVRK